jgi:hypothetical protein
VRTKLIGGPRAGHWVDCDKSAIRFAIKSDGPPLFPFAPELKPYRMHTYNLMNVGDDAWVYVSESITTADELMSELIRAYKP